MDDRITVHGFETSNNWKVRVALGFKGIPFTFVTIDPGDRKPLLRLSGQPLTPVLQHGDRVLFDSAAILRYLDANFPGTPRLFGPDAASMREVEAWESFARRELAEPMLGQLRARHGGGDEAAARAVAGPLFDTATARLEERLEESEWLVADRMTAADVTAAPVVRRAVAGGFAELPDGRAATRAWVERVLRHDPGPE